MSSIEWTDDTWNPITGCTRVSSGCDNCYSVTMTRRLAAMGQEKYTGLVNPGKGHFNGVVKCHPDVLSLPLRWRKPRRVFVNSMSDLFHEGVPDDFIARVWQAMHMAPKHTFQILTKRPERMRKWVNRCANGGNLGWMTHDGSPPAHAYVGTGVIVGTHDNWPLPNVWLGTSVEDQNAADERIPHLLETPAAVRFLSCEPLLGPIDLSCRHAQQPYCTHCSGHEHLCHGDLGEIHWVIAGGESGPGARPMHPDWARSLRDQCATAGVPFFFKQWGTWSGEAYPVRVGKKKAGRVLDGRLHDEYPA